MRNGDLYGQLISTVSSTDCCYRVITVLVKIWITQNTNSVFVKAFQTDIYSYRCKCLSELIDGFG